jgi:hypothetical protein
MEVHKIKIQGRFGNQLFQVAMMDYLNTYKKKRYILDARWSNPKDLALLLNLNIIKKSEILEKKNFHNNITKNLFYTYQPYKHIDNCFDFAIEFKTNIEGFFQNFEVVDLVKSSILIRFKELLEIPHNYYGLNIMHIRLGDYINNVDLGVIPENYYLKAVEKTPAKWFIVTDDAANLPYFYPNLVKKYKVLDLDSKYSFLAMVFADNLVISNSTFSWWASYLRVNLLNNTRKAICIYPWESFAQNEKGENRKISLANLVHEEFIRIYRDKLE